MSDTWFVYILQCADESLYTGVTTDLKRRLNEHNLTSAGAKYTRARRPVVYQYCETHTSRSAACKRESAIKSLNRKQKWALIDSADNQYPPRVSE